MNRIYFADKGHTRKHGCPNLWPVAGKQFSYTPRDIFSEPGLVAYINPKLVEHKYFEAHISIYNTAEVGYRSNWNGVGEHMTGGCILNATAGTLGYVSIHSAIKSTERNTVNDSGAVWHSRQEAISLLREAILQFRQYFPYPENLV